MRKVTLLASVAAAALLGWTWIAPHEQAIRKTVDEFIAKRHEAIAPMLPTGGLMGVSGPTLATPTVVDRGTFIEVPGANPYSTPARSIGTAASDRVVIVPVAILTAGADRHITGLTIGGVTATKQAGVNDTTGSFVSADVWTATVPSGTTAVLAFTCSGGTAARIEYQILTATGLTSETPDVTGTAHGGASALSASLTLANTGLAIGCFAQLGTSAAPDFDTGIASTAGTAYQNVGQFMAGVQQHASSGSKTFAMAAQVTSSQALAACVWYASSSTLSGGAFSNSGAISGSWIASYAAAVDVDGPGGAGNQTIVSGASMGTAASDRINVVAIVWKSNFAQRTLDELRINGIVATPLVGAFLASDPFVEIFYAANPTGTTGNIQGTANNTRIDVESVHVFRIVGQTSNTPLSIGSMETASGGTRICIPPSSFTVGVSGVNDNVSATTLSGLTTDDADRRANDGTSQCGGTSGHATGSGTAATLSIGSNRARLCWATWV